MYEVAMSSRGETTQSNGTDMSGNMSSIDGLGGLQERSVRIDYVYLVMKCAIACFLTLLVLGGYKLAFAGHEPGHYAAIVSFDAPTMQTGVVKKPNNPNEFKVEISREFVSAPALDPMVTASVSDDILAARYRLANNGDSLNKPVHYVVQPGDSLNKIARVNNLRLTELISINGIENPELIRPGTKLLISR